MQILMRGGEYTLALRGEGGENYLVVLRGGQVVGGPQYVPREIDELALAVNTAKAVFSALIPGAEDEEGRKR